MGKILAPEPVILATERPEILATERREILATERRGGARLRRSAAPMQHMSVCRENQLTHLFLLVVLLIILVRTVDKTITDCGNMTQVEHWADDASKMQIWFSTEKSLLSALSRDLEGGRRAGQSLAQS